MLLLLLLIGILPGSACTDSSNKTGSHNTAKTKIIVKVTPVADSENPIIGGWKRVGVGDDHNKNGVLDESENKINESILAGVDYFQFEANGDCIYDKDMKFKGTYEIKMDKKDNAIFIYPAGLPAELSREEKDKNALIFRITSLEAMRLVVKPAHLGGRLVVYQRI